MAPAVALVQQAVELPVGVARADEVFARILCDPQTFVRAQALIAEVRASVRGRACGRIACDAHAL